MQFAANLLKSLDAFFELHPRFKEASFYLSGESYAGTYIPVTANEFVKRGGEMKKRTKVCVHVVVVDVVDVVVVVVDVVVVGVVVISQY